MANILVGVTGGIAAYKIPSLVSALVHKGHNVRVIMTESAMKFITPLPFSALSHNQVFYDDFTNDGHIWHIELAQWADLMVIAPATYNTIKKIVIEIADNMLTSTVAAMDRTDKKIVLCPAMNTTMWYNLESTIDFCSANDIFHIITPDEGKLACGTIGKGKLPKIRNIVENIENILKNSGDKQ